MKSIVSLYLIKIEYKDIFTLIKEGMKKHIKIKKAKFVS